jgi:hypothetical protein
VIARVKQRPTFASVHVNARASVQRQGLKGLRFHPD